MILFEECVANILKILNVFVNVTAHSFSKEVSLDQEVFLLLVVCPCKLWEFTNMVKAKDFGTTKASKYLSLSCIILNKASYFIS